MSEPLKALLLVCLAAACAPSTESLSDDDRRAVAAEVTASLAELTKAMNGHDVEGVLGFYSERPDFAYLGCTEYVTGGESFRRLVGLYYGPRSDVTFEQRVVTTQVLSPNAVVVSQRGSSTESEDLFWTQVLVKEAGRWVIIYEHESWPDCAPPRPPHPFTGPSDSASLVRPGGGVN
jgi:ketosteroid isomerase-like protein